MLVSFQQLFPVLVVASVYAAVRYSTPSRVLIYQIGSECSISSKIFGGRHFESDVRFNTELVMGGILLPFTKEAYEEETNSNANWA